MPERAANVYSEIEIMKCYGICSDNIEYYRNLYTTDYNNL